MLQQGAKYRTPGGQLLLARQGPNSNLWWLDDPATNLPAYLERSGPGALPGSLDRLDYHPAANAYQVAPCDLCLDDLVLVEPPAWEE